MSKTIIVCGTLLFWRTEGWRLYKIRVPGFTQMHQYLESIDMLLRKITVARGPVKQHKEHLKQNFMSPGNL